MPPDKLDKRTKRTWKDIISKESRSNSKKKSNNRLNTQKYAKTKEEEYAGKDRYKYLKKFKHTFEEITKKKNKNIENMCCKKNFNIKQKM